jgi:hypothetical protein
MTHWMDDYLLVTRGELHRRLRDLWDYVMSQTDQITMMGEHVMARVDELRTRLAAATDEIARDLEDLRGRLAQQDEALAAELESMVARLEAMGQDPQNPVPDAPADGGPVGGDSGTGTDAEGNPLPGDGTEVVNPTPGAEDNPDNR